MSDDPQIPEPHNDPLNCSNRKAAPSDQLGALENNGASRSALLQENPHDENLIARQVAREDREEHENTFQIGPTRSAYIPPENVLGLELTIKGKNVLAD